MTDWQKQVPSWYQGYVSKTDTTKSIEDELNRAQTYFESVLSDLSEEQSLFRYEEGKWSIKDLIQHLIDAERVFAYRALRIARGDLDGMNGYDHERFVLTADADEKSLSSLMDELSSLRQSTILMFRNFKNEKLENIGSVGEIQFSPRMLGYIIAGHQLHHADIISEKYVSKITEI